MMNMILSIFLCLAMAFGGAGELPAEPEAATTWTLRNVALEADGEEYILAPEAQLTAAIGANRASARFAVESGGKALLPVAAEVTKEALRLSFGTGERVYELSDAALMQLAEEDAENLPEMLDAAGELFLSYGAMCAALRDPEAAQAYGAAVLQAFMDECATGTEPAQVELDGATLDGQKISLRLTPQNTVALLEALGESGIPGFEEYMRALLTLANLASGADYQSFTELFADADVGDFALPMTITAAGGDGVNYVKEELELSQSGASMAACVEAVARDTHTQETLTMSLQTPDGAGAECDFSATITGPATAYDGMNGRFEFTMTAPDGEETETATLRMTMDENHSDGLGSGSVSCELTQSTDGASSGGDAFTGFGVDWNGRREDDDSVTWAVELTGGDEKLRFELNRAEGAYADPFKGMEAIEIDPGLFDSAELSAEGIMLMTALGVDSSQMALEASQLAAEPSVQALAELFEQSYEAEEDFNDGDEDDTLRSVETLEEAAEIYGGDIPEYAPPAGWERTEILASAGYLVQEFENAETGKTFELDAIEALNPWYVYSDGTLAVAEDPMVQIMNSEEDVYSATVRMPGVDGATLMFSLEDGFSLDEFEELLSGLS